MDAATVDAVKTLGFPIIIALALAYILWRLAQWFMRTGDEFKTRAFKHVDDLDANVQKILPQLDRIERATTPSTRDREPGFARGEPAASH